MPRTIAYRAGGFTNCGISYTKFSQEELAEMKDRVMTENEALGYLKNSKRQKSMLGILPGSDIGNTIIKALEELKQYRTIGTPEELQEMKKDFAEALSDWRQYRKVGTLEECQAAMEKQIPYKPSRKKLVWGIGKCKCGVEFLDRKTGFCGNCGQKLDWEDEE